MIGIISNIVFMIILITVLYYMQKKFYKFTTRVFIALGMGMIFGILLQLIYGASSETVKQSIVWFNLIGNGYVSLLQMIVMPLIIVSIISAIINLDSRHSLEKIGGLILFALIITTAIAAFIGVMVSLGFHLSAEGLISGTAEAARSAKLQSMASHQGSIVDAIISVIPTNPFYSMTGQGSNATLSTVLFSIVIGISCLGIQKKKPESAEMFKKIINAFHDVVMRMVTLVLRLTPYGVLALMTKVVAQSNIHDIVNLGKFVVASYLGLIIIFGVHLTILLLIGLNPFRYVKKVLPVLAFAFSSRSSAGTLPLNVETQRKKLGISEGIANLSASLGVTIGQNGCAGLYPAMLAIMVAATPGSGIDINAKFIIILIVVTAVSSFGVAGVGGGATFAALIVLSAMGLPVALVGLLISIEPLIDMGRTAVNVSGAMASGAFAAKVLGKLDPQIYNSRNDFEIEK